MIWVKMRIVSLSGIIMIFGWAFAITSASLPFFGISDYRKFAICLPFETSDRASLGNAKTPSKMQ